MSIRRRSSISEAALLVGVLLFCSAPARADENAIAKLAAAAPSRATYAGVAIDKIAPAGFHLRSRDDRTPERGGIVLSFDDSQGRVRAVVRVAVAADAAGARAFVTRVLRGVSGTVDSSAADEIAFATGDEFLVAARGNIAYAIDAAGGGAGAIADVVKKAIAAGAPSFPRATIALAPTIDRDAATRVKVAVPAGATSHLRASGAYISRSQEGPVLHPFAAGNVEVTAIVCDALGRVSETTAKTIAR